MVSWRLPMSHGRNVVGMLTKPQLGKLFKRMRAKLIIALVNYEEYAPIATV